MLLYNETWDFHLQASSPALKGGKTDFNRLDATTSIDFEGLKSSNAQEKMDVEASYTSPAPAEYFGVFGTK